MKTLLFYLTIVCLNLTLYAQKNHTISGTVEELANGEKLIVATIYDKVSGKGTVSNTYGFFSLTLPKGKVVVYASYVGYAYCEKAFYLTKDTIINFKLEMKNQLDEVSILSQKNPKIEKKTQMSQIELQVSQIEKMPTILGEVDILKTLQLLPGVQGGTEGLNGVYVRGGSPDQNLIILDGVPVYNVSHIMGFLSVFNTDAIKNVTLTKGGFPARYGGRLSSVIEINMKEGNKQELQGAGGIGLLSSRFTIEGPLIKDRSSFMLSGRRNYIDLLARPFVKKAARKNGYNLDFKSYFYDLNAKINHRINNKHTLYASAYLGSDVFYMDIQDNHNYGEDYQRSIAGINWGNLITTVRWNYQINNKLFANTTMSFSQFKFNFNLSEEHSYENHDSNNNNIVTTNVDKYTAKYVSGIHDWVGKIDFDYIPNSKHYIHFGASNTYHTYNPGATSIKGDFENDTDFRFFQKKMYSHEYYVYFEDGINLGLLKANLGMHLSGFSTGKTNYLYPQPRIGLRYLFHDKWSLKASFASMAQYINLLTNESLGLPTDLWVPSTEKIKPQTSWQTAVGLATTLNNGIELSIESYYKKMNHVISYKEGANFYSLNAVWEDKITQGKGDAYGSEFLLQKKTGKTTGWLGYTLSWNNRQFDAVNFGKNHPYKYDRRHDVELVVSHKLTDKINLSGTWVYGTGNAFTLTEATYIGNYFIYDYDYDNNGTIDETETFNEYIDILGEKNSHRMPAYHRLDLGIEFLKKTSWGERSWTFSLYNAYNHKNPFFIYLNREIDYSINNGQNNYIKSYKQVSLLPIIPAFSYRFKF